MLGNHVIYGDWDDTYCNQFLVYWHLNGLQATVFLMGGSDYGGGIDSHVEVDSSVLDEKIYKSKDNFEAYDVVSKYVWAIQADNEIGKL